MLPVRSHATRLGVLFLILGSCVGCDQAAKRVAARSLEPLRIHSYLGDTVRVQYVENNGGFLGLGGRLPSQARFWLFTVFNGTMLLILTGILLASPMLDRTRFAGWALVLAGGLGNLIDRLVKDGMVIDFLNLGVGSFRTGIFNVADVAISGGLLLLVVGEMGQRGESAEPLREPIVTKDHI